MNKLLNILCFVVFFLAFFLLLGIFGALEMDIMPLGVSVFRMVICLVVMWICVIGMKWSR